MPLAKKIGFIGLGNVGRELAGSILRNGFDLTVRDLDKNAAQTLLDHGASWADSPRSVAEVVDIVITCLVGLLDLQIISRYRSTRRAR